MTRSLFGTDGVRGTANIGDMTPETIMKLGQAAGIRFCRGDHRHRVIIGKDTRLSGYMIEPALTSGFISAGMDVILVGPMPTPAISMLTRSMRADIGVMISASHNPYMDNGIKIFGPDGVKLSDKVEREIEELMKGDLSKMTARPENLGRAKRLDDALGRYIEFVKHSFPKGMSLEGLKVVVDCANGAAYYVGPIILQELGAEVTAIANAPNGFNINDGCGSTHPEMMRAKVLEHKADIGIALDGDADRLAICDEKGEMVDGDQIMAMIAGYWKEQGRLKKNGVVATVMSNLGLERYFASIGLELVRTKVGDRYVSEHMREHGYNLGGEQSGHIILSDYASTGDGLVAALQALAVIRASGKKTSEAARVFKPFPQTTRNLRFDGKNAAEIEAVLAGAKAREAIAAAEKALGDKGRVLVRRSGTEPVIRVMIEGEDLRVVEKLAAEVELGMGESNPPFGVSGISS